MSADRVRSGIDGLDNLIEGGFPKGFCYAVVGGPGSGKTTFGVQFLCRGAMLYGEKSIYVTLEEPPYSIANTAQRYGWNMYDLESRGALALLDASPIRDVEHPKRYVVKAGLATEEFSVDGLLGAVNDARRRIDAKRCVIDSLSALVLQYRDEFEARQQVLRLVKGLTEMRLTSLLLGESQEESEQMQKFGFVDFLAQGVIYLRTYRIRDTLVRAIEIRKMRGVKIMERICPYGFTPNGIVVYPHETVFAH